MFEGIRSRRNSFSNGVGIGLILHFWQILIIPVLTIAIPFLYHPRAPMAVLAGFFALTAWSLTQFIYMGPAIVIARRAGKNETAKGLILVAAIGVLLNGACDALVFGLPRLTR
jgi:hypothetical protein